MTKEDSAIRGFIKIQKENTMRMAGTTMGCMNRQKIIIILKDGTGKV